MQFKIVEQKAKEINENTISSSKELNYRNTKLFHFLYFSIESVGSLGNRVLFTNGSLAKTNYIYNKFSHS